MRIPNMFDARVDGSFRALFVQGEDIAQSDPNTAARARVRCAAMELVVVQDLFLNETAKFAHVFLPGTSFLEKDGTFTNAERRINRVRPVMAPRTGKHEWEIVCEVAQAMGYPMHYDDAAPDHGRDRSAHHADLRRGSRFAHLDEVGSVQWPCNDAARAERNADHAHRLASSAVKGKFFDDHVRTCRPRSAPRGAFRCSSPPAASSVAVQRRGADAAHRERACGTRKTSSRSTGTTPRSAASPTVQTWSRSRVASAPPRCSTLTISDRIAPGRRATRRSTTPVTGANVVTTEHSDWATNCPEYKVTAVQVSLGNHLTAEAAADARVPVAGEC